MAELQHVEGRKTKGKKSKEATAKREDEVPFVEDHLTVMVLVGDCLLCLSTSMCVNVACLIDTRLQLFLPTTCAKMEEGIVIFLVLQEGERR